MLKIVMIGNVGRPAKIQEVGNKKCINFTVAHNEKWTDAAGVEHERTVWVNCSLWRKPEQSLKVAEFLQPGTKIYFEGTPQARSYEGTHGPAASLDVLVDARTLNLLSVKEKQEGPVLEASAVKYPEFIGSTSPIDDDIPF